MRLSNRPDSPDLRAVPQLSQGATRAAGDDALSLKVVVGHLTRRRWLILAVASTVLSVATLQLLTTAPSFEVSGTLQVDPEDPGGLAAMELIGGGYTSRQGREEYVRTQSEKLRNRELLKRVARKMDLAGDETFNASVRQGFVTDGLHFVLDRARGLVRSDADSVERTEQRIVDRLLRGLTIRVRRDTRLVDVAFKSHDAELSSRIVSALLEESIARHLEGRYDSTTKATDFLRDQLDAMEDRIAESEAGLLRYAQQNDIVNLNEQETASQQKLRILNEEMAKADSELSRHTAIYEVASQASPDAFPEILGTDVTRDLAERKGQLERDRATLLERYGAGWPAVATVEGQLDEVRSQLRAQRDKTIRDSMDRYQVAQRRRDFLQAELDAQRVEVDLLNEKTIQYQLLKDEVEANRQLYDDGLRSIKEASLAAGLRSSNLRIVDQATPDRVSITPKKPKVLMLALVVGLVLGGAAAVFAESWDTSLKNDDDIVRHLGINALGVIPRLEASDAGNRPWRRNPEATDDQYAFLPQNTDEPSWQRAWEGFRLVRTSILLSHIENPPRMFTVTSAMASEGKTTTASNLALALAQTGQRTLLIDLDLRRVGLSGYLPVDTSRGITSAIVDGLPLEEVISATPFDNLFLLPGGPLPPNPTEFVGAPAVREALAGLREKYEFVVIDTPPSLPFSDALVIAPQTDGVILVAKSRSTRRDSLRRASELMAGVGAEVLGAVINQARPQDVGHGDGSYYAYGYGYGYGKKDRKRGRRSQRKKTGTDDA